LGKEEIKRVLINQPCGGAGSYSRRGLKIYGKGINSGGGALRAWANKVETEKKGGGKGVSQGLREGAGL